MTNGNLKCYLKYHTLAHMLHYKRAFLRFLSLILLKMRSEYVVLVCALFVAGVFAAPKITANKSCKHGYEQMLDWLAKTNITGPDSWILNMHAYKNCSKCPLFKNEELKKWPQSCKICTDHYWDHIKDWKSCSVCSSVNWFCDTCRKHFVETYEEYKMRGQLLKQHLLAKMHFQ